jgi:hypothetical protein
LLYQLPVQDLVTRLDLEVVGAIRKLAEVNRLLESTLHLSGIQPQHFLTQLVHNLELQAATLLEFQIHLEQA